ncbi:MAG: hypothetical protein ABSG53_31640 [Thermoguttaceae bacterium]
MNDRASRSKLRPSPWDNQAEPVGLGKFACHWSSVLRAPGVAAEDGVEQ